MVGRRDKNEERWRPRNYFEMKLAGAMRKGCPRKRRWENVERDDDNKLSKALCREGWRKSLSRPKFYTDSSAGTNEYC